MKYTWLLTLLRRHRSLLVGVVAIQLLAAVFIAAQPFYLQQLIAAVMESEQAALVEHALLPIAALLGLYLAVAGSQMVTGLLGARLSANLLKQLQMQFLTHSSGLPVSYFRSQRTGELVTRFNHDIGQVQNLLAGIGPQLIKELLTSLMLLLVLFVLCPLQLALSVTVLIAIAGGFVYWLNGRLMRFAGKQRQQWSGINHSFNELVRGIETIKAYNAEQRSAEQLDKRTGDFRELSLRYGQFSALWSPAGDVLLRVGALVPLLLAFMLVGAGNLAVDIFLVYFFCASLLMASVSSVVNGFGSLQPMLVGVGNLAEYFALGREQASDINELVGKTIHTIELKNIHYGYRDNETIIKDFNGNFQLGKVNSLAGNNGVGKTSLVEILLGFAPLQKGEVLVNGKPLSQQQLVGLRTDTSLVSSGQYLFEGTIRENLQMAKPNAKETEMNSAIDAVGLVTGDRRYPLALDTVLQADGKNLSDGERQKVIIARVLLSDAKIIIFDEPLAHIDRFSEQKVVDVIEGLAASSMVLVISHRGEEYGDVNRVSILI